MNEKIFFDVKGNSMFPTFKDGESVCLEKYNNQFINKNDIVVCNHPLKKDFLIIKRVTKIKDQNKLFLEGDNISLLESEDSHNFGYLDVSKVIAIKRN